MKTFETEKHNIPEGATHTYELASRNVGYYKLSSGNWCFWSHENNSWYHVTDNECYYDAKPIPQTKEVEWVNGELLDFNGEPCSFIGMSGDFPVVKYASNADSSLAGQIDEIFEVHLISKPETEAERVERERLENGEAMYIQHCKNLGSDKFYWDEKNSASKEAWCKLAEQYRKESE